MKSRQPHRADFPEWYGCNVKMKGAPEAPSRSPAEPLHGMTIQAWPTTPAMPSHAMLPRQALPCRALDVASSAFGLDRRCAGDGGLLPLIGWNAVHHVLDAIIASVLAMAPRLATSPLSP